MCKYKQRISPHGLPSLDPPSPSIMPVDVQERKELTTYDTTKIARKVWSSDIGTPHIMLTESTTSMLRSKPS
jgi:hypothetical protein